jgi:acetolactate decarboxylase
LRVALGKLYPDGVIDRTDTRVVSNNSPCGGDVASYLTGGRLRFGTHFIDKTLKEGEFIVQQISTKKTIRVRINPEIYPHDVRMKMKQIESGNYTKEDLREFQELQWGYGIKLISHSPFELFFAGEIENYSFPEHPLPELGVRHDNDYKNE